MPKNCKTVYLRPVGHVFGQKQLWHDNQPCDIMHVNGQVVGTRYRIPNPKGTRWETWAPAIGYGAFDNDGKFFFWSPDYLSCGLNEAVAELI